MMPIDLRVLYKEPLSSLLTPHIDPISFTNTQILKYRVEKGSLYKKKRKTTSVDYFPRPSVNYTWLPSRLSEHLLDYKIQGFYTIERLEDRRSEPKSEPNSSKVKVLHY